MKILLSLQRRMLLAVSQPWFAYAATIFLWGMTLLSRFLYNGLVYGFDYGLFHPDGSLYAFRALLFAGYSQVEAGEVVARWYADHSFLANPSGQDLYFENNAFFWDQYMTRILYPLLSTPFVMVFGIPGMLVVPSATYLVVLLVSTNIAIRLGTPVVGWVVALLVTSSTSISRWMFANITDGLLLLFVSLFVFMISGSKGLQLNTVQVGGLVLLISLSAITRFSGFFWMGVGLLFLLHKKYLISLVVAITTVIAHIPIFLRPFSGHVLPGHNDKSLGEKILIYPVNLIRVTTFELGQLVVLDRVLLILLVVSLLVSLRHLRKVPAQLFVISVLMLWITGSINGVLGVNFRYQLPLVPVMLYLLVWFLSNLSQKMQFSLHDTSRE